MWQEFRQFAKKIIKHLKKGIDGTNNDSTRSGQEFDENYNLITLDQKIKSGWDITENQIATLNQHVVDGLYKKVNPIKVVNSIKIMLINFDGVANTVRDGTTYRISLSESYFDGKDRREVLGVISHELVHVWQNNANGTLPFGLIEGIADYIRLKLGLSPPHWNTFGHRSTFTEKTWSSGYQYTAYFLWYLEETFGDIVFLLNQKAGTSKFDTKWFVELTGYSVERLWEMYVTSIYSKT